MEIRVETPRPHIALVTIANEPRRNAMNRAMLADLAALWDRLDADAGCRCVVLTGAGEKAFVAGADIKYMSALEPEQARSWGELGHEAANALETMPKPAIAAVNGDCVGGGLELLLSTDIRAAVSEARFGLPEVRWSIYPFGGATVKLTHQIGHVHAMDLLLTGRLVDAGFAVRIGLVNAIVERATLMDWALDTAAMIAANSPSAVQAVKTQISASIAEYAKSREASEQELGDRVRAGPHFAEGIAAFREKRKPDYR